MNTARRYRRAWPAPTTPTRRWCRQHVKLMLDRGFTGLTAVATARWCDFVHGPPPAEAAQRKLTVAAAQPRAGESGSVRRPVRCRKSSASCFENLGRSPPVPVMVPASTQPRLVRSMFMPGGRVAKWCRRVRKKLKRPSSAKALMSSLQPSVGRPAGSESSVSGTSAFAGATARPSRRHEQASSSFSGPGVAPNGEEVYAKNHGRLSSDRVTDHSSMEYGSERGIKVSPAKDRRRPKAGLFNGAQVRCH